MSELSQPKKPRSVSDDDTIADAPVGPKTDASKDGVSMDGASMTVTPAKRTTDLDKTEPDLSDVVAESKALESDKSPLDDTLIDATLPDNKVSNKKSGEKKSDKKSADKKSDRKSGGKRSSDKKPALEVVTDAPGDTDAVAPAEASSQPETSGTITLRVFGRTDVGQVREHNEDNFVVADLTKASRGLMEHDRTQTVGERGTVLGVCDGMGGAAAGEVASQLAVDIVYQRMLAGDPPTSRDDVATRLVQAIETAGTRIFSDAKADRSHRGMGTTATVAALIDDHLFLGQVGDSRGYLLRGDRLVQVTRDQSLVNQLIEAGQLTEEEAETFEHNNIILQALGTADSVQVDLTYVELRRGDTLLLCSDGLSGMVRNDEIREVLRGFDDPLEVCRELTDRANLAGGHDNVTVVVAKFEGDGLRAPSTDEIADLKYRKYELAELTGRTTEVPSARSSLRPAKNHSMSPDIEVGYDYDSEYPEVDGYRGGDDPVELPREQAPSWIVTMMIVSAVTCVVVAGYYLLR